MTRDFKEKQLTVGRIPNYLSLDAKLGQIELKWGNKRVSNLHDSISIIPGFFFHINFFFTHLNY